MDRTRTYPPDSEALTHDCRAFLIDRIVAKPGIYLSALGNRTAASLSAIRYHLRVLERAEIIRTEKRRGKRRFYPVTFESDALRSSLEGTSDALLDALESNDEPTVSELAADIDRDPSTISYHLDRLDEAGVVTRERKGRTVVNTLTPAAKEALSEDRRSSPSRPTMLSA